MEKEKLVLLTVFKSQYGSKLYGTDGPQSDTDWKYIFLPHVKDVLLGKQVLKTKFVSPNEVDKTKQVDEDFIPIQKFATDFLKGVPYAVEIAFSPVLNTNYIPEYMHRFLTTLKKKFLNKKLSGFLGFVNNIHNNVVKRQNDTTYQNGTTINPKDVYHGLRVAIEATELLFYERLTFPFPLPIANFLREFKNGNVNPSVYFPALEKKVNMMENALLTTTLQELTPQLEEEFEQWLFEELYHNFYRF